MNFGEYLVSSVCAKFRSNRKEIQILHDFRAATAQPAESSASDGRPKLEARLAKIAMYAYGTWCMQNPSWVQCPPSFLPNYTSRGTKVGSHPLRGGSKLRWLVSGLSRGMNPRPSAIPY